ncbi:monovalent cation/H+ antiporter subunit D [Brevundimonas subvibrioides]|uniref:NADH dehydrogenase (Quinone) n=1 Tax=Brevundimonas subvibrioides (strain ATCC 15264 / DSM 4735 / LMG 14903 / NBRC 16000 / CB 81) TaxID=633149 RepID=D9QIN9_BRESC|nr:monovalent cation/H+ antiporter subunit D [Brevundimonas subvibrioides]ADL01372.1 NADH dehydrogenase (quinone) [Brevundimonas subvibrioides ATCC 15264]
MNLIVSWWVVTSLLLPAVMGAAMVLLLRHRLTLSRLASIGSCLILILVAAVLVNEAGGGTIQSYALGNWRAPFGIVLVLDRLSAMMLLLTAILGLIVMVYAISTGTDRKGWHFHPLFQFQLLGLNGAFLTGDLFNLFVFFEVLLIASYGLMLHGQGGQRLKAGVQYVIINLVGSTLFLVAVGLLYGVTGTLNMADLAVRVAAAPAGDQALLAAAGLLLTTVFALKAALVPLHFWLPGTYAATTGAVAALFAIMTKVGAYSIIRTSTLIFGEDAGGLAFLVGPWLLPAALVTIVIGFIGMFAARGLRDLAAWAVVGSMGTVLCAVSVFTVQAMGPALYYILHSTLAGAALFLIVDLIAQRRAQHGDSLTLAPRFRQSEILSALFFLAAIAAVGLPPLSGFVGKLLVLDGVRAAPHAVWIWGVILTTTVLGVLALARAGSMIFWKSAAVEGEIELRALRGTRGGVGAAAALLLTLAGLTVLAGPVTRYTAAAATQLFAPEQYIAAVLGPQSGGRR